jgi:tRNA(Ile)-lysidine synthase
MAKRLQDEVIFAKPDAQATLHINSYYYVRYQKKLYRLTHAELYAEKLFPIQPIMNQSYNLEQMIQTASGKFKILTQDIGLSKQLLNKDLKLIKSQRHQNSLPL